MTIIHTTPTTVCDVLRCTSDDIAANRRGLLSARQCELLPELARAQQFDARREAFCSTVTLGGCVSFFAFAGIASLIDAMQKGAPGLQLLGVSISIIVLLGALGGYWFVWRGLWWAIRHTRPAQDLKRDLSAQIVRRVTGRVAYRDDRYAKSGAIDNLQIGEALFEYQDALREVLPEGTHVTAYYTPYRRVIVALDIHTEPEIVPPVPISTP